VASITWQEIIKEAAIALKQRKCSLAYIDRLKFEKKEIEKQGAIAYWVNLYIDKKKFSSNPNHLVLPWLLGMVDDDPIVARTTPILNSVKASAVADFRHTHGFVPPDLIKDPDQPDVDIDCLPEARDPIKDYATKKYGAHINDGYGAVCSVGTWQTYKFRSAIIDVCSATAWLDKQEALSVTTKLPEDVDDLKDGGKASCKGRIVNAQTGEDKECGFFHDGVECPKCGSTDTDGMTIGKLLQEHADLKTFYDNYPQIIKHAVKLVGRIRNMGMHAGALIIADRSLYGNIPMAKNTKKGYWISMWTEGRNTQLSKFGYVKWDILGLKTLKYIFECCKLIEANRGISFENMSGWDDIDPTQNRAGHFFDGQGQKQYIELNDKHALALANAQKTDGVFQFDTDLAKCCAFDSKITTDGGLKKICDLDPAVDMIQYIDIHGDAIFTNNYDVQPTGIKKMFNITTDDGRTMLLSKDHRVLTSRGWIIVDDLKTGDDIMCVEDFGDVVKNDDN
jgi:hypothetical protein